MHQHNVGSEIVFAVFFTGDAQLMPAVEYMPNAFAVPVTAL